MRAMALALLLAACNQAEPPPADTPGARLEQAAIARGLVPDPKRGTLNGSWASDTDRLCIVPAGQITRIGASIDYGEGQGCAASGDVERDGATLRVRFGDCRIEARYDGERIAFPPTLPAACERLCSGRASLTALTVEQVSQSTSEAAMLRGPNGKLLCAG